MDQLLDEDQRFSVEAVTLSNRLQRCGCRGAKQPGDGGGGAHGSLGSGRRYAGVAAALAVALVPKCPFCVAGYAALLGVIGVGPASFQAWTTGLTLALGGIVLAGLVYRCRSSRARGPLVAGCLGTAALVGGKLDAEQPLLVWAGVLLIAVGYAASGRRSAAPETPRAGGLADPLPRRSASRAGSSKDRLTKKAENRSLSHWQRRSTRRTSTLSSTGRGRPHTPP